MRRAGALTATCLDGVAELVSAGTPLSDINTFVLDFAAAHDARPATLGYKGYEYACCTSVNHVVCHGFPNNKKLRDGDIVNVDVTLVVDGWHGDSSRMYAIGKPKRASERLVRIAFEAMMHGIRAVRPGARLGDIGHAIQSYAASERCSVVRDFCGHGIGRVFHDSPDILNFGRPNTGPELREGMIFTVEPMINLGRPEVKMLADDWTAVTRDRSLSAQFEHSIGVTVEGFEIFTLSPRGLDAPGVELAAESP
ncbi:methionine aminopeptidase, type I [Wenxinia marina DSM 24838]|uniref:Methionine aminopeptidase n=2 Tax=Wenxinia TaxID=653686 RepID=A0A0D0Q9X4_9RHOB|nr:methionine aminopeptidase, type I [Wenxinia marina DSM 24838]